MRMMKSMAEKKIRKMGMKRMKKWVIRQCLGNGEWKNLWRRDREPQRVLKFDFPFLTVIYGDWFVQHPNHQVNLDGNKASGIAGDSDDCLFEHFAYKVLAMAQDLPRMTTKYTTIQILERARAVTTSKLSSLRCNKMSTWNLAMKEEKESVSADLHRPKAGYGYLGRFGFTG
jgi:hypothetical protein